MKSLSLVPLLAVVLAQASWGQQPSLPPEPNLNLLWERVHRFWSLLQQGRRAEALKYVEAESQNNFAATRHHPVSSFVVEKISFGGDPNRVSVSLKVGFMVPPSTESIPLSVTQRWVQVGRNWFLKVDPFNPGLLFGSRDSSASTDQTDGEEERISAQLGRLSLQKRALNFGKVKQGQEIEEGIAYRNDGDLPISIRLSRAPSWLHPDQPLFVSEPGSAGTITLKGSTRELDGRYSEEMIFSVRHGTVSQERRIKLDIEVEAPVSISPWPLVLGREVQHEVRIRNNTHVPIQIRYVSATSELLQVEQPPRDRRIIPAAGQIELVVRWKADAAPRKWPGGSILVHLEEPVEGRRTLEIPVLRGRPD